VIKIKIKGVDKVKSKLDKLAKKVEAINGKQSVDLKILLNPTFIQKHTRFKNAEEFFSKGGFSFNNQKEFRAISEKKLDKWITKQSDFKSWQKMLSAATTKHILGQIGF